MTEQEAYEAGLRVLELWGDPCRECSDGDAKYHALEWIKGHYHTERLVDLRTDPAFAWKVEERLTIHAECHGLYWSYLGDSGWILTIDECHAELNFPGATRGNALYTAVVALGREHA